MLVTIEWMQKKYAEYNDKLFGGQLPPIQFKIGKGKKTWGHADYRFSLINGTVTPLSITVSNYHDSPEEVKINTFIHEMIHIYDYATHPEHFVTKSYGRGYYPYRQVTAREYDAHGAWFMAECERINKFGFKVSKNVQREEVEASKLNASVQKAADKRRALGNIFGFMHRVNSEPSREWFMVKTNDIGMKKKASYLLANKEWYSKYEDYIEWYRCHSAFLDNQRNTTDRGWFKSTSEKDFLISKNQMELVNKTVLVDNLAVQDSPKPMVRKYSADDYANSIGMYVDGLFDRNVNTSTFKRYGKSIFSLKERLTNIDISMEIDKNADMIRLTFDNKKVLNIKFSAFLSAKSNGESKKKYGRIIYNYLKSNNMVNENSKLDSYARIIREAIDEVINDAEVPSEDVIGMRHRTKEIGDGEFIGAVE